MTVVFVGGRIPTASGSEFSLTKASEKKNRAEMLVLSVGFASNLPCQFVFLASSLPSIPFVKIVRDTPVFKPYFPSLVPYETLPRKRPNPSPPPAPDICPCHPSCGVGVWKSIVPPTAFVP